jgi:hypothetical protein
MKFRRIAALGLVAVAASQLSLADDKKKYMTVHVGNSTRQVNNHPWSYTTPGHSDANCSTTGTIDATGTTVGSTTDIDGSVRANTDCSTTYRPPRTTTGNRITVNNASWVTDTSSGDQYQIECTANWIASRCSFLGDGDYKAALEGNNLWITGMKGMKEMTAKYHILQYVPARRASPPAAAATVSSGNWTDDEKFTWNWYMSLPEDDKKYVREFCSVNPTERALLPHAKTLSGASTERALYCSPWVSAKAKL